MGGAVNEKGSPPSGEKPPQNQDTTATTASQPAVVPVQGPTDSGSSVIPWPDPPGEAAYHGLAGEFVRAVEPHSEADPAGLLVQFLVAAGSTFGPGPHARVEADRHGTNLFGVLVGATARGRKGTSWGQVRRVIEQADGTWPDVIETGLASGEGLIKSLEGRGDSDQADRRSMAYVPEFARLLRVMSREGATIGPILRDAWDGGRLQVTTRADPLRVDGAHVSLIGHITRAELLKHFNDTEAVNGFGNRILWAAVRRSKFLPEGGRVPDADLNPVIEGLAEVLELSWRQEIGRTTRATRYWWDLYPALTKERPGLLGAVTARAEAQVLRLALIYAVLDRSREIDRVHLEAARAVWDYCDASARWVFGEALGDPLADRLLEALEAAGEKGLSRADLHNALGRNIKSREVGQALQTLADLNLARAITDKSVKHGRPPTQWYHVPPRPP